MKQQKNKKVLLAIESSKRTGPNEVARKLVTAGEDHGFFGLEIYNLNALLKALPSLINFDLFHFYSQTYPALLLAIIFKLVGKKVTYTLHGSVENELTFKSGIKRTLWTPMHRFIFWLVDGITYPSDFNKSLNSKFINTGKPQQVIPNPYNFSHSSVGTERDLDVLLVTSFRLVEKAKGVDTAVEILHDLNQTVKTSMELHVVGDGPLLEEYKKKYANAPVKFYGYRDDIENFYSRAKYFLYISYLDNQPVAILDAIAHGAVIVANDIGDVRGMLPDGFVFSTKKEIEAKLQELEGLESHKTILESQFKHAKARHDHKLVTEKYKDFFNKL